MKNTSLLIFIIILSFSACKKEEQLKFPFLITSEYDTIITVNYNRMVESSPVIYGVNVKDTLDFSFEKRSNEEDYSYHIKNIITDSIVVNVDANNSNFHSHEINYLDFTPPPPKISDSVYDKRIKSYVYEYVDFSYDDFKLNAKKTKEKRKRKHLSTYPVFIYNKANNNRIINSSITNGYL